MVNLKLDGLSQKKLGASANGGQNLESLIAYWGRAVLMFPRKIKLAQMELASKQQLPEELRASDFDVVRARALSGQI